MKSRVGKLKSAVARAVSGAIVLAITLLLPAVAVFNALHVGASKDSDPRKVVSVQPLNVRAVDNQPLRPFNEPVITVTFDDGWESVYTDALPALQKNGIPTTQFIISGNFNNPGYLSYNQVKSLKQSGHEIGSHTVTHPDLTKISEVQLLNELENSKSSLSTIQPDVADFAIPYGSTNPTVQTYIKRFYRSARESDGTKTFTEEDGINIRENFDSYNIRAFAVMRSTDPATLQKYIDYTIAHNGWLVLAYHQIDDNGSDNYGVSKENFEKQMEVVSKSSVRVATEGSVLDALFKGSSR
jgi:peptidoglycan/xylan/chitin deacetylase (PgdA/CDA1 family)